MSRILNITLAVWLFCIIGAYAQDDAIKDFRKAIAKKDGEAVKSAVKGLFKLNNADAVKEILDGLYKLAKDDNSLYWVLINGAAAFTSKGAIDEIANAVIKFQSVDKGKDLLFALQNNRSPFMPQLVNRMLKDGNDEIKFLALDVIPRLKSEANVLPLINTLEQEASKDSELKRRLVRTLSVLTNQTFAENVAEWKGWYEKNKDKSLAEMRGQEEERESGGNQTVAEVLDDVRWDDLQRLRKGASKESIVVIKGKMLDDMNIDYSYDHIEKLLDKLGIPHIVVDKGEFEKVNLDDKMAVIVNCTNCYEKVFFCPGSEGDTRGNCKGKKCPYADRHKELPEDTLSDEAIKKIKDFVTKKSGYLFTEDWAMQDVLLRAFPGFVSKGVDIQLKEVAVQPGASAATHPYIRQIFATNAPLIKPDEGSSELPPPDPEADLVEHTWVIDAKSPTIRVDSKKVTTLLYSPQLEAKYKGGGAVAVTFGVSAGGKEVDTKKDKDKKKMAGGRVMHVLSHFGKQESQNDEYALQNLLVNFLIEAHERVRLQVRK